ncbi:MAG: M1 family aminopeptidase [Candidatus Hydrothermarchaeales archaeon]
MRKIYLFLAILCFLPAVSASAATNVDILHYDIVLEISPGEHAFHASITMQLEALEDTREVVFVLNKELRIDRTVSSGKELKFERRGDELIVVFGEAIEKAGEIEIRIDYSGTFEQSSGFQWGYIGEDVSYMIYESLWYPTIHGDRAPASITLRVPKGYSTVTSGELVEVREVNEEEKLEYVWEDSTPAFGISFVVGRYRTKVADYYIDDAEEKPVPVDSKSIVVGASGIAYPKHTRGKVIRISCYLTEEDFYFADECIRASKKILEFYISRFKGYPYDKFAVVEMPESFFGGHGDQGFIMLQANVFKRQSLEFLAHEIAHNWWGALVAAEGGYNLLPFYGIKVSSSSTPSKNLWLNEGFATYSAMMFLEAEYGRDKMLESLKEKRREYLQVEADTPIAEMEIDYGSPDYHAILYSKGAFVLHMLRYVVGEEAFNGIIDVYIQDYGGRSATLEDFQRTSEDVYGELDWFFNEWIRDTAIPDYAVDGASVTPCSSGYCTRVSISQRGDLVKMPLDVTLRTSKGELTKRIWMDGFTKEVEFTSHSNPVAVELDKEYWLLESDRTNNIQVIKPFSIGGLKAVLDSLLLRFD